VLRGFTRHFLGDPRGAIEDHTRALALRPDDRRALLNRGAVLQEVGDHAAALRDLDRVVADDPSALLFRGRARLALDDLEGAVADWSAFVERFPDDLDAKALREQLAALRERLAER
jgi:regulator of sirC expression with transglutaminase-like and TPR domain